MLENSVFCKLIVTDQLPCLHIQHPKFFAEICLQGAQLTQFIPAGKNPLIWLSPTAQYHKHQGLRGGIPICWPWFGALEKNPDSIKQQIQSSDLAHGFVRTMDWHLTQYSESAHQVDLTLSLKHSADTLKIWPFEFQLNCHFSLSKDLSLKLETQNLSKQPMHFSQALHSYFPINDINRTRILGAEKQIYVDALDQWNEKQQQSVIAIKEEVDRLYFGKSDYQILTPTQLIRVCSNSKSSVIWNPWVNKSKRLSQFSPVDYQSMLCIESANVLHDSVCLPAKQNHTLSLNISS